MHRTRRIAEPFVGAPPRRRLPFYKRPAVVAFGSATIGFCCGAAFWHMIGFWSFVSDVVLRGPQDVATVREARASDPVPVAQRPTGSISPARVAIGGKPSTVARAHLTCSIALADPAMDEVHVLPCPPGTGPAPVKPVAGKADRLLPVETVHRPPAPALPSTQRTAINQPPPVPAWAPVIRGSNR